MHISRTKQIAIIVFIAILVGSATFLRFIPHNNIEKSSNWVSTSNQPNNPLELTDDNFASALNNSSFLVLDFYYPGCGPCKFVNNITSELSSELQGQVSFGRMNVREKENSQTVKKYKVSAYPTLLFFDEGILVDRKKGNISKSDLLAQITDLKPGLDASRVKLGRASAAREASSGSKSRQTPEQAKTAPSAAQKQQNAGKDINLIGLGTKNPDQAMLITDATIDSAISQYQPLMVIVGFTDSCGYCKLFNVTVSELASELQGQAAFGMIDTQKNKNTKAKYNITGVPTALIFKDGKLAGKVIGNKDKSIVVAKLKGIEPELNTSKVKIVKAAAKPKAPKQTPEQVCVNMTKSDKPLLQAFVVSQCPFGLQMQRIMADIIRESKDAEEYLKVMYIGSVDANNNTIKAMHGEVEAQENLRQICIREEQPEKYWDYVGCYMREGKSGECQKSVSMDVDKLDSCTNDSSRGLVYAQKDFDLAHKFKIIGSPTMLMNDKIVKESDFATNTTNSRSPEAVKELLCCGFNKEPSFCSQELNNSRMATMFSAK